MATKPKDLFTSLAAGDMLEVTTGSPFPNMKEKITLLVAVLRVDNKGGIYLSQCATGQPVSVPDLYSPFRWSDQNDALIDGDGDVPGWYSHAEGNISLEPGGAMEAAAEYAKVPRAENVSHKITFEDLEAYKDDPLWKMISGICQNGEAGNSPNQLSLVLDLMGVNYDRKQLIGLCWFLLHRDALSRPAPVVVVSNLGVTPPPSKGNPLKH